MKNINTIPTTRLVRLLLGLCAAGAVHTAGAFTYSDGDLMLVFRKDGFNDVEFNLGSVSNYLGKVAGTKMTVSNWDANVVRANYNNSLASVKFLLVAATSSTDSSRRIWSTSAQLNPATPPTDLSGSRWGSLRSKLSYVGTEATNITASSASQTYVVASSEVSSYTYIVSDGGQVDAATISGLEPFPVETENPATLLFYELKISNLSTKPAAAVIGSFCMEASGALTFTAGPLPPPPQPQIAGITRVGSVSTVSFNTTNCVNYRLRYTADVTSGSWTTLSTMVAGDGAAKNLTDNTSASQRFYSVEAFR